MPKRESRKPPVIKFRSQRHVGRDRGGCGLQNDSDAGAFYTVTVQRSYQVDNEWNRTTTLTKHDLLPVAALLTQAWNWITEQLANRRKEEDDGPAEGLG